MTLASPSERGRALREQHEQQQRAAETRRQQMVNSERTATGIVRAKLRAEEAKGAVGALNRKMDEALDQVRVAFQREAQLTEGQGMQREDDAHRAPVLDSRKSVR